MTSSNIQFYNLLRILIYVCKLNNHKYILQNLFLSNLVANAKNYSTYRHKLNLEFIYKLYAFLFYYYTFTYEINILEYQLTF